MSKKLLKVKGVEKQDITIEVMKPISEEESILLQETFQLEEGLHVDHYNIYEELKFHISYSMQLLLGKRLDELASYEQEALAEIYSNMYITQVEISAKKNNPDKRFCRLTCRMSAPNGTITEIKTGKLQMFEDMYLYWEQLRDSILRLEVLVLKEEKAYRKYQADKQSLLHIVDNE